MRISNLLGAGSLECSSLRTWRHTYRVDRKIYGSIMVAVQRDQCHQNQNRRGALKTGNYLSSMDGGAHTFEPLNVEMHRRLGMAAKQVLTKLAGIAEALGIADLW
jgi:hypothetical protein